MLHGIKRAGLIVLCLGLSAHAATLNYDYDAALDTAGNGQWETETTPTNARNWTFTPAGNYSPSAVISAATNFTQAYTFGGGLTGATTSSFLNSDITGTNAGFEVWLKPDDLVGNEVILESGGATHGMALLLEASSVRFATRNTNANTDASTTVSASDISDFMQVAGVVDGANNRTVLYVNGVARSVVSGTKNWSQGSDAAGLGTIAGGDIGAVDSVNKPNYSGLSGQIAQVRLYNGPMNGGEVTSAYASRNTANPDAYAATVLADNPASYYRFGEQAGSTGVVNYTMANADGTDSGAGVTHGAAALAPNTVTQSVHLDGASAVTVPGHDDINLAASGYNQKTLEVWFKADALPGAGQHAVIYEQGGGTNGMAIYLADDGKLYMGGWVGSTARYVSAGITAGETYHVALSWNALGDEMLGFLNGGLIDQKTGIPTMAVHTGAIAIGALNSDTRYHDSGQSVGAGITDFFTGTIDELATYNMALTRATGQAHFIERGHDLGITSGATLGMSLNYDASFGTGDSTWEETTGAFDSSGNTGTLDWTMTSATRVATASAHPGITAAFDFAAGGAKGVYPGGTSGDSWHDLVVGDPTDGDATIELWMKASSLTGKQVIFETGGTTTGTSIRLNGDMLEFATEYNNATSRLLTFDLDADNSGQADLDDFVQVVAVLDLTNDVLRLFVNGIEQQLVTGYTGTDWDGGDGAGIGGIVGSLGGEGTFGTGYGAYTGQLAILRLYDHALTGGQIAANYTAVTGQPIPEPAAWTLLALTGLALAKRRRAA